MKSMVGQMGAAFARLFGGGVKAQSRVNSTTPRQLFGDDWDDLFGAGIRPLWALREAIVYLCLNRICGAISPLPIKAYSHDDDGGMVPERPDAVTRLLNRQPHPMWTAAEFWDYMVMSIELYGNGYACIERNMAGTPIRIKPFHPESVEPYVKDDMMVYRMYDRLPMENNYDSNGKPLYKPARDVLHFKNSTQDGLRGRSTLFAACNSLDYKAYMDRFSMNFWRKGLHSQIAIRTEAKLTDEEARIIKEQFIENAEGSRKNLFPIVLGKTGHVEKLGITPRDAQMMELEDFRSVEIARAFGVPDVLLNMNQKVQAVGKATSEVVRFFNHFTIRPKLHRMSCEISVKLAPKGRRTYCFKPEISSAADEVQAISVALGGQPFMTVNEARMREGLTRLTDAKYDVPSLMPGTPGAGPGMPANPAVTQDAEDMMETQDE